MSIKKLKRFEHSDFFDSNLFTCYNYTDQQCDPNKEIIQIAAFDPGVVNTGCRIERRELQKDGKVIVKTVQQKLLKSGSKTNDRHYFMTMMDHLYEMSNDLYHCDYILIESQMIKQNPEATRMSQHIISTLLNILQGSKTLVIEILPTVKSKAFGVNTKKGEKKLKSKELKVWAVGKATEILESRKDTYGLKLIGENKKKDDHCDVVLYCDAWYRYLHTGVFSE